jgi:hypothetical protein
LGRAADQTFGQNLKRMALSLDAVDMLGLFGFLAYRTLIGVSPTTWRHRLTVVIDNPIGTVRGAAATEISSRVGASPLKSKQAAGPASTLHTASAEVELATDQEART